MTETTRPPLAVVGVSALFPGSTDSRGFWRDIVEGSDLLTDVPESHWLLDDYYDPDPEARDRTYVRRGAFLPPVPFDPLEFGLPPNALSATDPSQLLALIVARRVLDDAYPGGDSPVDRERISVILGIAAALKLSNHMGGRMQRPILVRALRDAGIPEDRIVRIADRYSASFVEWQESTFPGLLGNVVAGRVANRLDLGGTNFTTDAACASSFSALSMAANELYLGQADMVITGGVDTTNDILMYMCFSKTGAFSATNDCRPFSAAADGTMPGEGVGMFALRRLEDAERDGDRIYALLRGIGSSSDGKALSVYAPRPSGQARALRRAYQHAGYGPDTVELLEAHGTATRAGDAAEVEALRTVFDASGRRDRQWCALGSVKSQVGHTKSAAGAAGLFKTIMALHHRVLPGTYKIDAPNPKLDLENSPFYLNTATRPWIHTGEQPRRAAVSSFGFGGSNFHATLEAYAGPGRPARLRTMPSELVLLRADSPDALVERCRSLAGELRGNEHDPLLEHLAYTTQAGHAAGPGARLAVTARDDADLAAQLDALADAIEAQPDTELSTPRGAHYRPEPATGDVALLFPGQGSQYVGMGAEPAMAFDAARDVWDTAAAIPLSDGRLDRVVFPVPPLSDEDAQAQEARLRATEWAQPAIGAASVALLRLLTALGLEPAAYAGHSFGELTALHAGGAFDLDTLLRLARRRGEAMRDAADGGGAMLAVAAPSADVRAVVAELDDVVLANDNGPGQVVLSGTEAGIAGAAQALEERGLTCRRIAVSTAFHSPLVAPAADDFAGALADAAVAAPERPVYANVEAAPYPGDEADVRRLLTEQIARPVRFAEMIDAMHRAGARIFVEVGPGNTLSRLVGDILDGRDHQAVALDRKGVDGVTALWRGLGRLAAAGLPLRFDALWDGYAVPDDPRERPRPDFAVDIDGSIHGNPYPLAEPEPASRPDPANQHEVHETVEPIESEPTTPAPEPATYSQRAEGAERPAAPAPTPATADWMAAYRELQRHMAEAQTAFQQTMAESHAAFLQAMESSLAALGLLAGGQPGRAGVAPAPPETAAPRTTPTASGTPAPPAPAPEQTMRPAPDVPADSDPAAKPPTPAAATPRPEAAPAGAASRPSGGAAPAAAADRPDVAELLLGIVAEKTGYPPEMLTPEMALEADLGIDSIKRVEILSAAQERLPGLDVDAAEMAALATLGEIGAYIEDRLAGTGGDGGAARDDAATATSDPAPSAPAAAASRPEPAAAAEAGAVLETLRAIVAEKTGYPGEMLAPEMAIEADLGIDSIKRVEILSALQERVSGLPELDAAELVSLSTLGDIADHIEAVLSGGAAAEGAAEAPERSAAPEPPRADGQATDLEGDAARFEVRAVASERTGQGILTAERRVAVLDGGAGVGEPLAERLAEAVARVQVVDAVPEDCDAVVFLGGLRDVAGPDEAIAVNRAAFAAAHALAERFQETGGVWVTVQDTGGDFGLSGADPVRAWLGGLGGLTKTAGKEWPEARVKAIDIERGGRSAAKLADALAAELLEGGAEIEVGLQADGERMTPAAVAAPELSGTLGNGAGALPVDEHSVLLVSGGARGVTAACVIELARMARPRLALLGRTPLDGAEDPHPELRDETELKRALAGDAIAAGEPRSPRELDARVRAILASREVRRTLDALEAAGAEAMYVPLDVRDADAVRDGLARVRERWGPVTGLIHAAGTIHDKRIADKTAAQFDAVFDTKVEGLRSLLAATADDPLELLVLFSSVAARSGNPGQSDYAMANEVLNKVAAAEARRREGRCLVRSLNWGPWAGGMVSPSLQAHFERQGVPLLSIDRGVDLYLRELARPRDGAIEVVLGSMMAAADSA